MKAVPSAIAAVIAFVAVLGLAACGGDTTGPGQLEAASQEPDRADVATGVPTFSARHEGRGEGKGKGKAKEHPACREEPYVDPDGCSPDLLLRTPDQVVSDLRAALAAEDWTAVACNYHPEGFVIDDQGVLIGRTEIVSAAQSLNDLFSGIAPDITDEVIFENVVRTLYTLDGGWIVIPDGAHTYVIEDGLITRQTSHGIIEFTGPPPDQQ